MSLVMVNTTTLLEKLRISGRSNVLISPKASSLETLSNIRHTKREYALINAILERYREHNLIIAAN